MVKAKIVVNCKLYFLLYLINSRDCYQLRCKRRDHKGTLSYMAIVLDQLVNPSTPGAAAVKGGIAMEPWFPAGENLTIYAVTRNE
jgi:hypothetical protein